MKHSTQQGQSFLVLKCRGEQMPLRDHSIRLALATPPYLGAPGVRQQECPTKDRHQYDLFLLALIKEAERILIPGGHLLLHTNQPAVKRMNGAHLIEFSVLRKPKNVRRQAVEWAGTEAFKTQYKRVRGIHWVALGVDVYGALVSRYSEPGDLVADVFSGSGNAALAALLLGRKPILLDLHHHRRVQSRLDGTLRRREGMRARANAGDDLPRAARRPDKRVFA